MRRLSAKYHGPQHLVSTQLFQRVSGIVPGSAERDQGGAFSKIFGLGDSTAEP